MSGMAMDSRGYAEPSGSPERKVRLESDPRTALFGSKLSKVTCYARLDGIAELVFFLLIARGLERKERSQSLGE